MNSPGNNTSHQSAEQAQFNWELSSRFAAVDAIVFPTLAAADGKNVSGCHIKSILRGIVKYYRPGSPCFPSMRTLAHEANCSEHTAKRAVSVLRSIDFIGDDESASGRDRRRNYYVIDWQLIFDEAKKHRPEIGSPRNEKGSPGNAIGSPRNEIGSPSGTLTPFKHLRKQPPPESARVVEMLRAEGIKYPRAVIDAARERGLDAAGLAAELRDNAAAIALDANRGAFNDPAAALASRLKTGHWPTNRRIVTPADLAAQRQRDSGRQREREQAAAHQAEADRRQAEQAEQLEQQFAPILDALTPEAREQLAHEALPDPFTIGRYYRRGLSDSFVRTALLKRIQAREQQAEEQALATSQSPAS